jgi:hypothetical protein
MTRIVVLANSWKHQDWCLAGIDLDTGKWVRPVTDLDDGRVPETFMKLGGYFPELLDVLQIPLDSTGPDFGFESENRTILPGRWFLQDRKTPANIEMYAKRPYYVLHNHRKYITPTQLRQKPFEKRLTLQLLRVDNFKVRDARRESDDKPNWKGTILSGGREIELPITDPVCFERLKRGHKSASSCILTVSLGMPYKPPDWDEHEEPACWKLISGVIEL